MGPGLVGGAKGEGQTPGQGPREQGGQQDRQREGPGGGQREGEGQAHGAGRVSFAGAESLIIAGRAIVEARQRLSALADRLAELRRRLGTADAPGDSGSPSR